MVDAPSFRNTLGRFASGITVVTAELDGLPFGLTVSAFMSVSLEPPLIAVSIDRSSKMHESLVRANEFAVSILAEDQSALSDHFAGRGVRVAQPFERFAGLPVVRGAIGHLVCSAHARHEAGDHTIFLGLVEAVRQDEAGEPLTYFRGKYGGFVRQAELSLASG
ncbi:MAG TPA: flavin reductase family protein [Trueperaceae bacterium]